MKQATHICANCRSQIRPKSITPGSFLIELVLWLAMIIPGLIYSLWRISARHKGCPVCGASNPVPINTPAGMMLSGR